MLIFVRYLLILIKDLENDSSSTYSKITIRINDQDINDDLQIANMFADNLSTIFTNIQNHISNMTPCINTPQTNDSMDYLAQNTISKPDFIDALSKLKSKAAAVKKEHKYMIKCSNTSNEGDRIDGSKATNVNITSGDEDKSHRRLLKVLLGGSNVYSACNGYLTSVS
ncbi:hypothetical protein BpHYR1_001867 [Brachionus plicatilis]|uniref:Uncharacterized protein n=1 Tax=Brachionus plicatilis TaxID=10195 RepID=A0A3M7PG45_BRAPC|nr:hypothetical protein BpHYR1_001867 [Brachionus plicatilis]